MRGRSHCYCEAVKDGNRWILKHDDIGPFSSRASGQRGLEFKSGNAVIVGAKAGQGDNDSIQQVMMRGKATIEG